MATKSFVAPDMLLTSEIAFFLTNFFDAGLYKFSRTRREKMHFLELIHEKETEKVKTVGKF